MPIKSLKDLKKTIQDYQVTISNIQKEIEILILNKKNVGYFSSKSEQITMEIAHKKKQIDFLKKEIKTYYSYFSEYTKFSHEKFIPFLTEFISYNAQEEYVAVESTEQKEYKIKSYGSLIDFVETGKNYTIITTPKTKSEIEKRNEIAFALPDVYTIQEYLSLKAKRKYICLETKDKYSLLNGPYLLEEYSNYPYLKAAAFDLIDLALQPEAMSDVHRLEEIKNKCYRKV